MNISPAEAKKLQDYLCSKFKHKGITVKGRTQVPDSVEVMIDGEFIATIYKDEDEGETSFTLNMAILDIDLDGEAAA
jgi:hypothetical protein